VDERYAVVSGYSVDPPGLQRADVLMDGVVREARVVLDRVRACEAALLGGGWQGPAASAFRVGWEEWVAGADAMVEALAELAALLGASSAAYATTDDAVRVAVARSGG
jgi:WXG100 family type VII secretion target